MNIAAAAPPSLSAQLWQRSKALHVQAERSGIIARILRGTASKTGYALLMHNLLPAYRELEQGLQMQTPGHGAGRLALPQVWRLGPLQSDLAALNQPGMRVLPEATAYAARISTAASGNASRLIAHAYTRTMGDLSGGQILRTLLAKTMGLVPAELAFYVFPAIDDIAAFKADYRTAIDLAGAEIADFEPILAEAEAAFTLTIALSEAVAAASGEPTPES